MSDDEMTPYQVGELEGKPTLQPKAPESMGGWISLYLAVYVVGGSQSTGKAKANDLRKWYIWFTDTFGNDLVDAWTPSASKAFRQTLISDCNEKTGKPLAPATINRILATLKTFGRWLHAHRPLLAGYPLDGVSDVRVNYSAWRGLDDRQLARLRSAVEQRVALCNKCHQNPILEGAVFHTLLHTGLRAAELCALDRRQYHGRGIQHVLRKAVRVQQYLPIPKAARDWIDRYIERLDDICELPIPPDYPLFIGRFGRRIITRDVARICGRIANQANAQVDQGHHIKLTPHMLRHTFLKHVADKHGIQVAQRFSGNVTVREVMRYTKPSDEEMADVSETLFD